MDALENSKKISLLAVAILFLFTFFNLILDSPRTMQLTIDKGGGSKFIYFASSRQARRSRPQGSMTLTSAIYSI